MYNQCREREQTHQNRVPIENSNTLSQLKIRPQRCKEIPGSIERNTAHYVAECRSEKYAEEKTRSAKQKIPKRIPYGAPDVVAEFDRDAAQNKQPEHDH